MSNYANIFKNPNPQANSGGYKNVFFFAPRADFLSLAKPTAAGLVLGDTLKIATAHTFAATFGFHTWAAKLNSATIKGATTGDDGATQIEWTAEFTLLGDSAEAQEQLAKLMNDDIIGLFKEADCLNADHYVQLGDECISPVFKVDFDGKTTKEGMKEYKVTVTSKRKFFYTGVVTMAA